MPTTVTSSSVEKANSSLKFIKNPMRSTMREDRLNSLLLLYVHKDIAVDYNAVLDTFIFLEEIHEKCFFATPW